MPCVTKAPAAAPLQRVEDEDEFEDEDDLIAGGPSLAPLKEEAKVLNASHLAEQIRRLESSVEADPSLAIGTAKELIETCCEPILAERGKPVVGTPDVSTLTKETLKELQLVPEGIPDAARGAEVIKRLLSNLGTIGNGLAELRGLYGTGLADAQKAKGWQERERLRQAAGKVYAGSVSRIDELAASFSEIEGTARSSQVFDEMTRVLAEEGVDQAIAYAATQGPGILEKVKARAAAAREKNRADLLPLLKSAQLQADRNQVAEADSLFAEILALAPDWPDARNAYALFLIQQGITVEPVEGNAKLREAVQMCEGTLALNQREKFPQSWAQTQNNLGNALCQQGLGGSAP